jgi:hypothetical protein
VQTKLKKGPHACKITNVKVTSASAFTALSANWEQIVAEHVRFVFSENAQLRDACHVTAPSKLGWMGILLD